MDPLTENDKKFLNLAIEMARDTYTKGNYPVGAVLTIDGNLIAYGGNSIKQGKSFCNHAEMLLINNNGTKIYDAFNTGNEICLYSTLEPCIQCLGTAVVNHINKIFYIQKDPNAGACDLKHDNIGSWYNKWWPQIVYAPYTHEPLDLMLKFFKDEIASGNTNWPKKMLDLLEK